MSRRTALTYYVLLACAMAYPSYLSLLFVADGGYGAQVIVTDYLFDSRRGVLSAALGIVIDSAWTVLPTTAAGALLVAWRVGSRIPGAMAVRWFVVTALLGCASAAFEFTVWENVLAAAAGGIALALPLILFGGVRRALR